MKDRILNLLLILAVAAALGTALLRKPEEKTDFSAVLTAQAAPTAAPDPLGAYRARRQAERAREQAALLAVAQDGEADAALRDQARRALMDMQRSAEVELAVEAALAAWGDGLCVVREGEMTVFLTQSIDGAQAALILDVAKQASGLEADKIRIAAF